MTDQFVDTAEALYASITAAAGGLPVAWENDNYEPVEGNAYLRVKIPAHRVDPSIGELGLNTHWGILEISLFYPLGTGVLPILRKADEIAQVFRRGTTHTSGDAQVRIESISRAPLLYDKAWAQLPLNIRWHCHLPN